MTRKAALMEAKIAGYHDDTGRFVRAYVESRVSRQSMNEAWQAGVAARLNGVRCDCFYCKRDRGEI